MQIPKDYDPYFDYESLLSDEVRACSPFRFFPKRDAEKNLSYQKILLFLIDFMMMDYSSHAEEILFLDKTYCFLVGVHSYALKKGGVSDKQAKVIDKIYEERRRQAIEILFKKFSIHNNDFEALGGVQ